MSAADDLRALGIEPMKAGRLTDEAKELRSQEVLDRLLGAGDEKAYLLLMEIAEGRRSIETVNRFGEPVTRRPSFQDMMTAMGMLMDRHRGRPVQKVQHDIRPPASSKWDPDQLSLEDIQQMRKLAGKAQVVDAEFTESKDTKK